MEYREYRAKTVNDAITEALIELEITSDMIEYEVIEEGSAGLLGLFSKEAVIRARRKENAGVEEDLFDIKAELRRSSLMEPERSKPEKKEKAEKADASRNANSAANGAAGNAKGAGRGADGTGKKGAGAAGETEADKAAKQALKASKKAAAVEAEESARQTKTPNKEADLAAVRNAEPKPENKTSKAPAVVKDVDETDLRRVLNVIFDKLEIKAETTITVDKEERTVDIVVDGDDTGDIIGKRGQTLDAIQYILSIIVNKDQECYFRVKLDTNNYRERRQKTLENLAKNMAAKVKKTRKKVALEPMNPYERRVIHSYLQSDKLVTTKSEGEEPNRRVVIYYKKS